MIVENNHERWKKMWIHKKDIENIKLSCLTVSDRRKAMKKFYKDQGIHPQKYTGHHGRERMAVGHEQVKCATT